MATYSPQKWIPIILIAAIAILLSVIALTFEGTYDSGDSIMHYLLSRHALQHPELLLDHWGKPFFTLLTLPFAQLGMTGMKFFNILVGLGTAWLLYKTASEMRYQLAWLPIIFLFAAPKYFLAMSSGFTEPLFGFWMIASIYLFIRGNATPAVLMLSFLPFIRTEGYMALVLVAVYLIVTYRFRLIPLLLTGSVVYAIIGSFYYGDLLWQFTHNPYLPGEVDNYGLGTWDHFPVQFMYVLGIPLYALIGLGIIRQLLILVKRTLRTPGPYRTERFLLVYGVFAGYFAAHVYFWLSPTIRSLGMNRVLIAIVPLGALIALDGFDFIRELLSRWKPLSARVWTGLVVLLLLFFPFSGNHAGLDLPADLEPDAGASLAAEVGAFLAEQPQPLPVVYGDHPALAVAMDLDPWDSTRFQSLRALSRGKLPPGSILIWDHWFAPLEAGVPAAFFQEPEPAKHYELLRDFHAEKGKAEMRIYRSVPVN